MVEKKDAKKREVFSNEVQEILERALERPGVKEMMSVYWKWELLDRAAQPYQRATTRRTVVATTDTSERMVLRRTIQEGRHVPTWSEILAELAQSQVQTGMPQFDAARRKYLVQTYDTTKRNTILCASKWTQPDPNVSPETISIVDEDLQGLMEVVHGLKGPNLDLILHSPGGSA